MIKFIKGRVYRHKATLDIDCEAVSNWFYGDDYITGKFRIFNRHNGIWYETKRFWVQKKDLINWETVG